MSDLLETAKTTYRSYLNGGLREAVAGSASAGKAYWIVGFSYRILAISHLLADGDSAVFRRLMAKAGHSRLDYMRGLKDAEPQDKSYWCGSKNVGFFHSLVAGDLDTANELAALAPRTHTKGVEYEEDFLFSHFCQQLLTASDDSESLQRICDRWDEVLEGKGSPKLNVSRAFLAADDTAFDEALDEMITEYEQAMADWRTRTDYREDLGATEGNLFVNGLAILRLAEIRGLHPRDEHPFMPSMARVPLDDSLPSFNLWRDPDAA